VVCQAIEAVVVHYDSIGVAAVIEGCWLLPEFAVQREYAGRNLSSQVHANYLHEPSIAELSHRLLRREDGWHARQPGGFRAAHAQMQYQFGMEVKRRAEAIGLPVIDSRPFDTLVDRAIGALHLSAGGA
jgi:2-phosphoglycerate kinase